MHIVTEAPPSFFPHFFLSIKPHITFLCSHVICQTVNNHMISASLSPTTSHATVRLFQPHIWLQQLPLLVTTLRQHSHSTATLLPTWHSSFSCLCNPLTLSHTPYQHSHSTAYSAVSPFTLLVTLPLQATLSPLILTPRQTLVLSHSVSLHLFILIHFHSFPFISVHPFIRSRSPYVFRSRTPTLSFSFPPDSCSTPRPLSTSCALALGHSVSPLSTIAT